MSQSAIRIRKKRIIVEDEDEDEDEEIHTQSSQGKKSKKTKDSGPSRNDKDVLHDKEVFVKFFMLYLNFLEENG